MTKDEALELIPVELREKAVLNRDKRIDGFHVYRLLSVKYDPVRKRGIDERLFLGTVRDGEWRYSRKFLQQQEIEKLKTELATRNNEDKARKAAEAQQNEKRAQTTEKIKEVLKETVDVRQAKKTSYSMDIILTVAFLASLAGYTSAVSIWTYWNGHLDQLEIALGEEVRKIPSHDTINRVLRLIQVEGFATIMRTLCAPLLSQAKTRLIHIDGQAVRASKKDGQNSGRYIFNVYDSTNSMLLTHKVIDAKDNEITVSNSVLEGLDLREGDVVTADAMNTQRRLVSSLAQRKVAYCFALKENHETFLNEVRYLFQTASDAWRQVMQKVDLEHGRIETRTTKVLPGKLLSKELQEKWPGIENGCIVSSRNDVVDKKTGEESSQERFFITSIPYSTKQVEEVVADVIRSHWSIESMHWSLDVIYNQDRMQCTDGNYMANRSMLNKVSLTVLTHAQERLKEQRGKMSIKTLHQLCSSPLDALDTIQTTFDLADVAEEIK